MIGAALLAAFSIAGGPSCGPDFITQVPVVCEQTVRPPFRSTYPVLGGDAEISARFGRRRIERSLPLRASWGCENWLGYGGLIALVSECSPTVGVAVFATGPKAPRQVRIVVSGAAIS